MAKKHPTTRIWEIANRRADEIVEAFKKQGVDTSKAAFISELILSCPLPEPVKAAGVSIEKKRKAQPSTAAVPAL